jgi:hypothetical protein
VEARAFRLTKRPPTMNQASALDVSTYDAGMLPIGSEFTPLERAVLSAICEMHPTDQDLLEAQLSTATFRKRDNTGAGFFTYFEVERDGIAPVGGRRLRDGPTARITGLEHGMSFILWLAEGYANSLEGYSNGPEGTAEIPLETVGFEIIKS